MFWSKYIIDMPDTGDDTEVSEMGPFELLVMESTTADSPLAGAAVTVACDTTTLPVGAALTGLVTNPDPTASAAKATATGNLLTAGLYWRKLRSHESPRRPGQAKKGARLANGVP
jgi:hypothetical protein